MQLWDEIALDLVLMSLLLCLLGTSVANVLEKQNEPEEFLSPSSRMGSILMGDIGLLHTSSPINYSLLRHKGVG